MKKNVLIISGIVLGVIIIAAVAVYFAIFRTSTPIGTLYVLKGDVQFSKGNIWLKATDEMNLRQNYQIRTGPDSRARVILMDTVIVTLEPDTTIMLKEIKEDNITIAQQSGSVWNKFIQLSGMQEYSVETPTTVATVRGTSFRSRIMKNQTMLMVGDGAVDFRSGKEFKKILPGMKAFRNIEGKIMESDLTPDEKLEIARNLKQDLKSMVFLRYSIIARNKFLYSQLKQQYNITDDHVRQLLSDIDAGQRNDSEMVEYSPVKIPVLYKLKIFDDKIKHQQDIIRETLLKYSFTEEQTNVLDEREILQADESNVLSNMKDFIVENEQQIVEQLRNMSNIGNSTPGIVGR